jgi:exoribonuclease R
VVFTIRVGSDGAVRLDAAVRAIIRSRAKLAYDRVGEGDLPPEFFALADRMEQAERARGAARVDPPEQEVAPAGEGYQLVFRPRLVSEDRNAALSLACNLAVADALHAKGTGLFRVMPEPDERAVARLRHTARAFAIDWPADMPLAEFEKALDPADERHAALMLAIRRAGGGAAYAPYRDGELPWHSAMAATYAHATAPLRRLADRYVVRAALAVANGEPVPPAVEAAFAALPKVMARADSLSGKIERAVIDLAEAVMLQGREGEAFAALVTDIDDRGARIQLCDLPVVARFAADGLAPGTAVRVRLASVDTDRRSILFERE